MMIDNSRVYDVVSIAELLNASREEDVFSSEYVRLEYDPENRVLQIGRSTKDSGVRPDLVAVELEDVRFKHSFHEGLSKSNVFNLHSSEAETFLTWLDTLKSARGNINISIDYMAMNDNGILRETGVHQETLMLIWDNGSRSMETQINGTWKVQSQMMAHYPF